MQLASPYTISWEALEVDGSRTTRRLTATPIGSYVTPVDWSWTLQQSNSDGARSLTTPGASDVAFLLSDLLDALKS